MYEEYYNYDIFFFFLLLLLDLLLLLLLLAEGVLYVSTFLFVLFSCSCNVRHGFTSDECICITAHNSFEY